MILFRKGGSILKFYKLTFSNIPDIKFAHAYETRKYYFEFNPSDAVEFSYIDIGDVYTEYSDGTQIFLKTPCFVTHLFKQKRKSYSNESFHRHYTFALREVKSELISGEEVVSLWEEGLFNKRSDYITAVVPDAIYDLKMLYKVKKTIENIIYNYNLSNGQLLCMVDFFDMLSYLTDWCFKEAASVVKSVTPSETAYCNKVIKYISDNPGRRIYIEELAEYAGISAGYLSRIFKSVTGYSIIKFINSKKIEFAKQLVAKNASIVDIIHMTGIEDEKYFYRLFKKYTGITVREYKKNKPETLR